MAIRLEKVRESTLRRIMVRNLPNSVWVATGAQSKRGFLGFGKNVQDVDLISAALCLTPTAIFAIISTLRFTNVSFSPATACLPVKSTPTISALHHSGDDLKGDQNGNDGLDNEIITVDLTRVSPNVSQIFFFLNNCGKEDFSQIPYASIRMYEGTPQRVKEVFAQYDVAAEPQYSGKTALIMGKLYRRNGEWKFSAIGDAYADANLCETIKRIATNYK